MLVLDLGENKVGSDDMVTFGQLLSPFDVEGLDVPTARDAE